MKFTKEFNEKLHDQENLDYEQYTHIMIDLAFGNKVDNSILNECWLKLVNGKEVIFSRDLMEYLWYI